MIKQKNTKHKKSCIMHKKNVEIYHSGWLVKSPPNHGSIFKAVSIFFSSYFIGTNKKKFDPPDQTHISEKKSS